VRSFVAEIKPAPVIVAEIPAAEAVLAVALLRARTAIFAATVDVVARGATTATASVVVVGVTAPVDIRTLEAAAVIAAGAATVTVHVCAVVVSPPAGVTRITYVPATAKLTRDNVAEPDARPPADGLASVITKLVTVVVPAVFAVACVDEIENSGRTVDVDGELRTAAVAVIVSDVASVSRNDNETATVAVSLIVAVAVVALNVSASDCTAADAGATDVRTPRPNAATATSAMRLKVVFVDICFLSISRSREFPSVGFE
jgi:hypothetical protein